LKSPTLFACRNTRAPPTRAKYWHLFLL
jgi:hypothetical protein